MERCPCCALAPASVLARPIARLDQWRRRLTVPQFTVVTGLLVITVGTLILATPACSSDSVGLWEALFTVTSAITVTGLSIIDVGKELTLLGQMVLAGLIVVGGLGLMAITTFLQGFVQGRSGLRHRLDRGRALDEFGVGGIGPTFNSILLTAAVIMGLGTVILYSFGFTDIRNPAERLWASLFHCISAYNNAGFGLFSDNLVGYRGNTVVNGVIGSLIVIGGIGSVRGAFVGALLVGMVDTVGRTFLPLSLRAILPPQIAGDLGPALASILIYVLMAGVLFWRPQGLFPARG